ncbi:MAG TPA: hypothetical protein VFV52_18240 [Bacilli bacterium]|nr:hypothetical protein [Bacilli bacterium]
MWKVLTIGTLLLVGLAVVFNLFTPWSVIPRHDPDGYVLEALETYGTDTSPLAKPEIVGKSYTDQGWRYQVTFTSKNPNLESSNLFEELTLAKDNHDGTYLYEAILLLKPESLLDWKVATS